MSTELHSFMDIFEAEFVENEETVQLKKIVIPIIQRDYAQGRPGAEVERVRSRFLDSLFKAVTEKPITLDFVYGDINGEGVMTPLDGQQRLTTLFLLHWYAAKKTRISPEEYKFLHQFSYETRYSARDFCSQLVDFDPEFTGDLRKEIVNQTWFPLSWQKDPTVDSMLVMLNAIDAKFNGIGDLWERLKKNTITFYFLPIKDMGLTDELYIKMNSRGKPLTLFEHFKAELEHEIRETDENTAKQIISKIDGKWTDLLWKYRNGTKDDYITDDKFLRYFRFICDIICYKKNESPQGKSSDEFDLIKTYFSKDCKEQIKNVTELESFFDCWCFGSGSGYASAADFLQSFMSADYKPGSITVGSSKVDIFEDCLHNYSDKSGRVRLFPLNRIVLLYAIIVYLRNRDKVTEPEFRRRIRIINNLIRNSEDEVSDRTDRNRIPAILKQVDAIILTGAIDDTIESNFNVNQLQEEKVKIEYLKLHPEKAEKLFMLEDNQMLYGQIGIVGLSNVDYADRFISLFSEACEWDKIDCALMCIGDYGQKSKRLYQYGSGSMKYAWDELFHKSANTGFADTGKILVDLLKTSCTFDNRVLQKIIDDFTSECESENEYPWRYYYVKYREYRPGSYGKLANSNAVSEPYMFSVLKTKSQWSQNTYLPYLKAAAGESHLSKEDFGQRLIFGDEHIICGNTSYLVRDNKTNTVLDTLPISQNADGIDTEDRIIKLKNYIAGRY